MKRMDTDQPRGDAGRNNRFRDSGHFGGHVSRKVIRLTPERVFMGIWAAFCSRDYYIIVLWVVKAP